MVNKELLEYIESKAKKFTEDFVESRIAFLKKKKITATGKLIASIGAEAKAEFDKAIVTAVIAFEDHGRFIEMRGLKPDDGGSEYLIAIMDWIEKKSFDMFKKKFEQKYGKVVSEARALNRMAWAIIKSRSAQKFKSKRWQTKVRAAKINELYNEILAGIPDIVTNKFAKGYASKS